MPSNQTINASDFKARCLDLLDRVANRTLERVTITKRGQVVGVLIPPDTEAESLKNLHGFMRGSVIAAPNIDLTAPILEDSFLAEDGVFHT